MSNTETIQVMRNAMSKNSNELIRQNTKEYLKKKHGKVVAVDNGKNTVLVHFFDSESDVNFWFENNTGSMVEENDDVWVEYTSNPAKGRLMSYNYTKVNVGVSNIYAYEERLPTLEEYSQIPYQSMIVKYSKHSKNYLNNMRSILSSYWKVEAFKRWQWSAVPGRVWNHSINYINGRFFITGAITSGAGTTLNEWRGYITNSPDGVNWTTRYIYEADTTSICTGVTYDNGMYIATFCS